MRYAGVSGLTAALPTRTLRLAALPTAPRLARVFVTRAARGWRVDPLCIETAELLVSELVTNAVKQTGRAEGPPASGQAWPAAVVTVQLCLAAGALRIEVGDCDRTRPVAVEQDLEAEGGRGLFLVEALARGWGCYTPADRRAVGKVVWAEISISTEEQHV